MKKMQLEVSDLLQWLNEAKLLYASDGTRRLHFTGIGNFEVSYEGVVKLTTNNPMEAIDKFNEL